MGIFGFESEDIQAEEIVEPDVPEVDEESDPTTKKGDIYILGAHRLMCGDSTSEDDLRSLLKSEQCDMVLTDPPYNMAYEGAGGTSDEQRKKNRILNDKMSDSDFEIFMTAVYQTMASGMKDGASCYVFYKELGTGTFINAMKAGGITFKQELIWVKNCIVLGGAKYQNMYEPCLLGCKGKSIKYWYAGRKERSVIEQIDMMDEIELREAIKDLIDSIETDVVRERKTLKNDLHPTMKPVKLLAKFIRNSSKSGDIVLDLFGGSGSTMMACEQLGRKCRMMELDPKYCDVIVKRWEQFTGRKAEKITSGDKIAE